MNFEHKELIKNMLSEYLKDKGININKHFECFASCNGEKKYTMKLTNKYDYDVVHCFRCGKNYDIFDLIGLDYNLNTFREQYQQACLDFNLEDEFNKIKYKKTAKKVKNNILERRKQEEQKRRRYDNFYNKLIDKRKELLTKIEKITDKNSKIYNDLTFKIEFVDEYSNMIIEYNDDSIHLINEFNNKFESAYSTFKKYYLDIEITKAI